MSVVLEARSMDAVYFPAEIAQINHTGLEGKGRPARAFLLDVGAPLEKVNRVLALDGQLQVRADSSRDPFTLSPFGVAEHLREPLEKIHDLVGYSLGNGVRLGFTEHDITHIDRTAERTDSLLGQAQRTRSDITPVTRWIGAVDSTAHDGGCFLGRGEHESISFGILTRIEPRLLEKPEIAQQIQRDILLHRESQARRVLEDLQFPYSPHADREIELMAEHFSPQALALIIADTTDVTKKRTNRLALDKISSAEELLSDTHVELNLLWETTKVGLSDDGKSFTWQLTFNKHMTPEELVLYNKLAKPSSNGNGERQRALVSNGTYKLYEQDAIPQFTTLEAKFWRTYYGDILQAVQASFALFPTMTMFNLEMVDPLPDGAVGSMSITPIHRDKVQYQIDNLLKYKHLSRDSRHSNGGGE